MNAPATQLSLTDARRGWARQLLDLPAEPSSNDSAAEVLQRLADAEFVPSPSWRQAMHALVGSTAGRGGPSPPDDRLLSFGEDELRREVEEFAARFFSIAPDQRRERWQRLRVSPAMTPALALRLDALAEGLDLEAQGSAGKSPDLDQLAELTTELSVLRPGPRAQLRRQKLTELGDEARRWQLAAAGLERHHPALAALAPDLLRGIQEAKPVRNRPAVPLFRPSPAPAATAASRETQGGSGGSYWWVGVVLIALWIVRAVGSFTSHNSPSPTPPYNSQPIDIEKILRDAREHSQQRQLFPQGEEGKSQSSPLDALLREAEESREQAEALRRLFEATPKATEKADGSKSVVAPVSPSSKVSPSAPPPSPPQ